MNYGAEIAAARRRRDVEIRRLSAEGLTGVEIASRVGCSRALVYELLNADRKAAYNARRAQRWRHLQAVA
jgi:transposase